MSNPVLDRKLAKLKVFVEDLRAYAQLDEPSRLREHYAIERLLQLLCEAAADIALQVVKAHKLPVGGSYREIFSVLAAKDILPAELANELALACGMRNILPHLYDEIDLGQVVRAVEPAVALYETFAQWALHQP
jgi:uncharacterized protein YutE (UPF0331/DUF86 family)